MNVWSDAASNASLRAWWGIQSSKMTSEGTLTRSSCAGFMRRRGVKEEKEVERDWV
jgi:hypothetical protein